MGPRAETKQNPKDQEAGGIEQHGRYAVRWKKANPSTGQRQNPFVRQLGGERKKIRYKCSVIGWFPGRPANGPRTNGRLKNRMTACNCKGKKNRATARKEKFAAPASKRAAFSTGMGASCVEEHEKISAKQGASTIPASCERMRRKGHYGPGDNGSSKERLARPRSLQRVIVRFKIFNKSRTISHHNTRGKTVCERWS